MRTKHQIKISQHGQYEEQIVVQSPSGRVRRQTDVKLCSPKLADIEGKLGQKDKGDGAKPREGSFNLVSCKSFPNIFNSNGYIKLQESQPEGFQLIKSKFEKSLIKPKLSGGFEGTVKKRLTRNGLVQQDTVQRKGKFKRRNTFKMEGEVQGGNSYDSSTGNAELVQQNINLKKKILQYQQKIEQLTNQIQKLNPKLWQEKVRTLQKSLKQCQSRLSQKVKEIELLNKKIQQSEEQKKTLTKKLEDIIQEQQIFKGSACSGFNLELENDNSGIGMDMMSTAEYIESLTDLEDELHHKKTQIFDLNKMIEQLKIKQHFSQLRHEQGLRRVAEQWSNKYKRLLNMYKAAKANRQATDNNRMMKLKTKTEFIDQEKQDLFNLSLSTDRSQLPHYN